MNNLIIIEKNGDIKNSKVDDINMLYKFCNYRNKNDFKLIYTWNYNIYIYELYGKTKGKKINKNMINLPSYISNELYGNICIIKKDLNNNLSQLNTEDWELWYNNIFNETKSVVNNENTYSDKLYYEVYDSE